MTPQRNTIPLLIFIIMLTNYAITIYSCMTTLYNDSADSILIVDHNDGAHNKDSYQEPKSILIIQKNISRRFGKAHEHANFTVYTKKPKTHLFVATYQVKQ